MNDIFSYEKLNYTSPDFPIIFHFDVMKNRKKPFVHWHESIEILAFTEGEAKVRIDDGEVNAAAGDIVVINTNCIHNVFQGTYEAKYYCLLIDREFCREFGFDIGKREIAEHFCDARITEDMRKIEAERIKPDKLYRQSVKLLSLGIVLRLLREHRSEQKPVNDDNSLRMIKDAITYIKQNYRRNPSVDEVADAIGYSKYYFSREFKRNIKSTVCSYITDMRMEYACRLLEHGDNNINEIALLCGYGDCSYFIKVFKKRKGITPGEYVNLKNRTPSDE